MAKAGESEAVAQALIERADDEDLWVRYQTAFALGEVVYGKSVPEELVKQAVAKLGGLLLDGPNNQWMRTAALSSLAGHEADLLATHPETDSAAWGELAGIVARRGRADELAKVANRVEKEPNSKIARLVLNAWFADPSKGVREILADEDRQELQKQVAARLKSAVDRAVDADADLKARLASINLLRLASFETASDVFEELADGRQAPELQQAAINLLREYDSPEVAAQLIEAFPRLTPSVRDLAAEALTSTTQNVNALLDAIEAGDFLPSSLPEARRQLLRESKNAAIRERATKALASTVLAERAEVVERYRPSLETAGDVARGQALFKEHCAVCHKIGNVGQEVGPNLTAIKTRGQEFILLNILDPSREVNPEFLDYAIITTEGVVKTGMIASESPTAVTLKRAEGVSETVLRLDIEEMRSTGRSLMPDGFEKQLNPQQMADVIAYLMSLE